MAPAIFFGGFRWFKRFYVQSPVDTMNRPRHSGLSHPDQRGSPGQENRLLEHETRRLTEELIQGPMWNPGVKNTLHVLVYAYLRRLLICIDSIRIHIAHGFFSNQYVTFTLLGYVVNWFGLLQGCIPDYIHCPDCSQNQFFPCFRTDQIKIWDQVNNATSWEIFFDQIPVSSAFCRCNPLRRGLWTWNDCNERLYPFVNRSKKNNDDDQVEF